MSAGKAQGRSAAEGPARATGPRAPCAGTGWVWGLISDRLFIFFLCELTFFFNIYFNFLLIIVGGIDFDHTDCSSSIRDADSFKIRQTEDQNDVKMSEWMFSGFVFCDNF